MSDRKIVEHVFDGFFFQSVIEISKARWNLISTGGKSAQHLFELRLDRQSGFGISIFCFAFKFERSFFQVFHISLPGFAYCAFFS